MIKRVIRHKGFAEPKIKLAALVMPVPRYRLQWLDGDEANIGLDENITYHKDLAEMFAIFDMLVERHIDAQTQISMDDGESWQICDDTGSIVTPLQTAVASVPDPVFRIYYVGFGYSVYHSEEHMLLDYFQAVSVDREVSAQYLQDGTWHNMEIRNAGPAGVSATYRIVWNNGIIREYHTVREMSLAYNGNIRDPSSSSERRRNNPLGVMQFRHYDGTWEDCSVSATLSPVFPSRPYRVSVYFGGTDAPSNHLHQDFDILMDALNYLDTGVPAGVRAGLRIRDEHGNLVLVLSVPTTYTERYRIRYMSGLITTFTSFRDMFNVWNVTEARQVGAVMEYMDTVIEQTWHPIHL